MKTRINRMALAIFFAAFLFAANVEAEGKGWIAFSGLEKVAENKLQLENWMINDEYWNFSHTAYILETETDNILRVENWMLNDNIWKAPVLRYLTQDKDEKLCFENWMFSETYWN